MLLCMDAQPCRLTSDQPDLRIWDKFVKCPHGIASAAHTGDHRVRKLPFSFLKLLFDLLPDDLLKVPHDHGKWMGAHHGAQHIQSVIHPLRPFPHSFIDRVLQRLRAAGHRMDLCAQKLHPVYIQCLSVGVLLPHINLTFHSHQSGRCGRRHPMLSGTGLRDDPCFAHPLCQKHLTQHVVDLVGTGMVQVLPLDIDLRAAQILCHFLRKIQHGRAPCIVLHQFVQIPDKFRVTAVFLIGFLQLADRVHQSLWNVLPSVLTISSLSACFTAAHSLILSFLNLLFLISVFIFSVPVFLFPDLRHGCPSPDCAAVHAAPAHARPP